MTLRACVGSTKRFTDVRTRDPHAVIPTLVDPHVGLLGHVAIHAFTARRSRSMTMVRRCIKRVSVMALGAKSVVYGDQLIAVRFVAICTNNAGRVHLALDE